LPDPISALAELLAAAGVDYALIGGHAVNIWVEPRFTADVALTTEAGVAKMDRLTEVLGEAGFRRDAIEGESQASGPDFARFVSSDGSQVLELQAAKTELQESLLARARVTEDGLRIATPEDLIVLKLIANRPKDRVDLLSLCGLADLDWGYAERWASRWDVRGLLEEIRRESSTGPGVA